MPQMLRIVLWPLLVLRRALINGGHALGFLNIHRSTIHGPRDRVHLGRNVGHGNNIFYNTRSGHVYVGDDCILSFNCMFLTGRHLFEHGRLKLPRSEQVPSSGHDIRVGAGSWIASGAIIVGGVTLGERTLVAAGAVVTRSFPDGVVLAGVPAKVIGTVEELGV